MIDKKAAQGKFARRVAKIAKLHGIAKIGGLYRREGTEVIHLIDWSRNVRHRSEGYEFDRYLGAFAPEFYRRVYGQPGDPLYHPHLSASLMRLGGGAPGTAWCATEDAQVAPALDEIQATFERVSPAFYDAFSTTAQMVEKYRNGGAYIRKSRSLANWEAAMFDGRSTRAERPGGPPPDGWGPEA